MEASKTRQFLRYWHPYRNATSIEGEIENIEKDRVLEELKVLEELASFQVAKVVDKEGWLPTVCPTCDHQLSINHGDGYYSLDDMANFCPLCGQRLDWCNFNN
jgi:rubrerythrin